MSLNLDKSVLILVLGVVALVILLLSAFPPDLEEGVSSSEGKVNPTGAVVSVPTAPAESEEKVCPTSCNDLDVCTNDYCNEDTNYECIHERMVPCCGNDLCEFGENCNSCSDDCSCSYTELCCSGECTNIECSSDSDCDDNDDCTSDVCSYPGTCTASCSNTAITPCCGNGICERDLGEDYESCPEDNCPSCSSGWGCKDSYTRGYQSSDCSWTRLSYCEYGCKKGKCKSAPCSKGYTYETRYNSDWVQIEYRYGNCETAWMDWYECSDSETCEDGACKVEVSCSSRFKCYSEHYKAYQNSDCSWESFEY